MIVQGEFADRFAQVPFAEWHDFAQTLGLNRLNESLRVGVEIGATCGQSNYLDAAVLEDFPEVRGYRVDR